MRTIFGNGINYEVTGEREEEAAAMLYQFLAYSGILGNRMRCLICRRCGAVLYQCVAEPHRFPQARR